MLMSVSGMQEKGDNTGSRHATTLHPPVPDDKGAATSPSLGASNESLANENGNQSSDSGYGSSAEHIFNDATVAEYWRNVYDKASYENRHRFDPEFKWAADEERKLVKKIDFRIMFWAWVMFCALDIHRRNINRAISDGMLEELGMTTDDFNTGQTIFLAVFLAAELPSGLISKKVGADRWIPFIMCSWSIVSLSQAFITSRTHFFVIKALLGALMGGFIPDIVLWLTYFYKSNELPTRLSWFWTALSSVNIFGSLLAAGVLTMRGINGWSGWQWLFLIEGLLTLLVGLFSWGLMPPGPCQTRNWFRGRDGWFSERDEMIMVNRLLRDDPSKGDMNNRQAVNFRGFLMALKDWEMWPLYLIGLTAYVPPGPPSTYLSYILRQIGFSVFNANLLAIPSQFMFAVNLLIITWVSKKVGERSIMSSISNLWIFPWLVALVTLPASSPWVRYALLTGILSYPYCHAILVAWNAKNSNAVRTRAISAALYNMTVQSGNIITANIYRDADKPLYIRGNKILLALCCFNIVMFYAVKAFYMWRNKVRERRWNALSAQEKDDYILDTTDEGQKRWDFRFAH
ncbi:major facilitator superfamily domain-containing protein [Bombardia bombarda]|uniref:Major facilitator superfamily domain-containing protein n=1 Tax=Bombardia bombarda TaxID=252184 RepID=A0AA39TLL3_9PEZI|nr:major facilitator superfamily domain-containing protein [Bombardia bombarda]